MSCGVGSSRSSSRGHLIMSKTSIRRSASSTRLARRSLVELTAAASRGIDDGVFVLSSGIGTFNPRSEHTGEKTSDQTILEKQATAPSPVAVLESRNAAPPRKDELLDSDTTTEMMVKIAKDYQNRACENIKVSLNAALDYTEDLVERRVESEGASKSNGGKKANRTTFGSKLGTVRPPPAARAPAATPPTTSATA